MQFVKDFPFPCVKLTLESWAGFIALLHAMLKD
jgi:hypothetical protein